MKPQLAVWVLGVGNPLRGDDGAAATLVQRVEASFPGVQWVLTHQLTPEWAETLKEAQRVLVIDAAMEGPPVRHFRVSEEAAEKGWAAPSSHHFGPRELEVLARSLYGSRMRVSVLSLRGESFNLGEGLSSVLEERLVQGEIILRQFLETLHA